MRIVQVSTVTALSLFLASQAHAESAEGESESQPVQPVEATQATQPAQAERGPAQPEDAKAGTGFGLGFSIRRLHDDFGMDAFLASPTFARDTVRFVGGGGIAFYNGNDAPWQPYGIARIAVEAGRKLSGAPIRLYGFGGTTALFLPERLSSNVVRVGGIGGFGFEFLDRHMSYFLEAGGIGTGAQADKLPGAPVFANGFLIAVGFRGYP
jgi:hypothetical protein